MGRLVTQIGDVLDKPGDWSWTRRWLAVLKKESDRGFHPVIPQCVDSHVITRHAGVTCRSMAEASPGWRPRSARGTAIVWRGAVPLDWE